MSIRTTLSSPHRTTARPSAVAGMIGPLLFLAVLGLLDLLNGRVDVSQHELGRYGVLMHLDFLLFGLLSLAFAVGLRRHIRRGKLARAGLILLGLFSLGPLLGTFTLDPGDGPPVTWHGTLHFIGFLLVALPLIPAFFVFARVFAGDPRWRGYAWYSLATGLAVAAVVFAPAPSIQGAGARAASEAPYPLWTGPASMLDLVLMLAWLEVVALRLWVLSRGAQAVDAKTREQAMTTAMIGH